MSTRVRAGDRWQRKRGTAGNETQDPVVLARNITKKKKTKTVLNQRNKLQTENERLTCELEDLKRELTEVKAANESAKTENEELKGKLEEVKTANEGASKNESLQNQNDCLRGKVAELESRIKNAANCITVL